MKAVLALVRGKTYAPLYIGGKLTKDGIFQFDDLREVKVVDAEHKVPV